MIFSNAKREEVRAANPEMKMTEISSVMGQKWKTISEKEKEIYTKLAEKDKERAAKEKVRSAFAPTSPLVLGPSV